MSQTVDFDDLMVVLAEAMLGAAGQSVCDAFASQLLVPREDLREQLRGFTGDPSELLDLVRRYDVALRPFLQAAGGLSAEE